MQWICKPGVDLGLIPTFLSEDDPRDPCDQINSNYQHGGGWSDFKGHKLSRHLDLLYPGDPPLQLDAMTTFTNESGKYLIVVYPFSWVVVIDIVNNTFRSARID